MSIERAFRELVSGDTRGVTATLLRSSLRMCEWPYTCAVQLRNRRFDRHPATVAHLPVPVISVGNLSLGGTGKTPMVAWLVEWLEHRQLRVAVISRGYAAPQNAVNDEALELALRLPHVPHKQHPDRVVAARQVLHAHHSQVIVLDDGFQHRKLHRDLDIVLLDALAPFGYGHVFPRGMLREPANGLRRAQVMVLTRAGLVDADTRESVRRAALAHSPHATWAEAHHEPQDWHQHGGSSLPLAALDGSRVAAFCGIGNPAAFRQTLENCGVQIAAFREYPDHFPFAPRQLVDLQHWVRTQQDVQAAVCTQKDLVKISRQDIGGIPLWALTVKLEFSRGRVEFESRLAELLANTRRDPPPTAS